MKSALKKISVLSALSVLMSLATPGQASTTTTVTAPYSRGEMCYKYFFPKPPANYDYFCHNDPPTYGYVPTSRDPGAPFNVVAASARYGELVVGGWERVSTFYAANVYKAVSIVDFDGPLSGGIVSATADITGVNVSSPTVNYFQVCLQLYRANLYEPLASDCFNKATPFRNLSVTANNVPANIKMRVEVLLNNVNENGGARATVANVTYTLP